MKNGELKLYENIEKKETHEDYILVDVPDICDHMQYENDYIGDVRPEYNFHLDELEG